MPTADYFVSPDGSDTSPYDTWAKASVDIQGAMSQVAATTKVVAVAPGVYTGAQDANIVPGNVGGAGAANNILVGDTDESYTDGGAATHGRGNGHIVIDATSGGVTTTTTAVFDPDDNWDYWKLKNLVCIGGGTGIYITPDTGSQPLNELTIEDCIGIGLTDQGIIILGWDIAATDKVNIYRTMGISMGDSESGFFLSQVKTTDFEAAPFFHLYHCYGIGMGQSPIATFGGCGLEVGGYNSGVYTWVEATNCLFQAGYSIDYAAGANQGAVGGRDATYSKVDLIRCVAVGYDAIETAGVTLNTNTNNYSFKNASGETLGSLLSQWPFIPAYPHIWADSELVDKLSGSKWQGESGESGYDIAGFPIDTAAANNQYVGPTEYNATYEPSPAGYPHDSNSGRGLQYKNDYTASGSGGGGGFLTGPGKLAR